MKELFVIKKKLNFFEKKIILNNYRLNNCFILDLEFKKNRLFYQNSKIEKIVLKNNILLEKNFFKIKISYEKKIFIFLKKNPSFITYKFSELNFSDFWWKLIFHTDAIRIFCKEHKIKKIKFFEGYNSRLSMFFSKSNDKIKFEKKNFLLFSFKFLYKILLIKTSLINFLKEIYSLIYSKNNTIIHNTKHDHVIYSNFPNGWNFNKYASNRFFGGKINKKKNTHLFSIVKNNQYNLGFNFKLFNKLKKIKNYMILESNGSLKNIFYSYFIMKKNKKNIFNKLNIFFKNNLIAEILSDGITIIEIPTQNIFIQNLKNFFEASKIKKIIISIPEFVDGRIINKISNENNILTYGLQHSSIGILQHSRFISMIKSLDKINKKYVSNKMFVENIKIKKYYGNVSFSIKVVGNIRINKRNNFQTAVGTNVYYIAEMHNISLLKERVENILKKSNDKFLFIRLHPGKKRIQEKIIMSIKDYNKNLFIDKSENLMQGIKKIKPELTYTSSPTVYIELITNDLKVVLVNDNSFITNYPSDIKKNKIALSDKFNMCDFHQKIHKVPTTIYGKDSENKIIEYFYE